MTSYMGRPKQGQVFLMAVSFRDQPGKNKVRPVIVVSNERATDIDVVAVSVTSRPPRSEFDVIIEAWREAGLSKPSIARTSKLFSVSIDQLQSSLGQLQSIDLQRILQKCRDIF